MHDDIKLRFKIDAYTPATIPMERLAEYMRELAIMLGEPDAVHFVALTESSTNIVHSVDRNVYHTVGERIAGLRNGVGEVVHLNAYRALNKKLKEDGTTGMLVEESGSAILLKFPGVTAAQPDNLEPLKQLGCIDGVLIKLGGRDDTVPVLVQDGDAIYRCNTNRKLARQLGSHIFGSALRFTGVGTWQRDDSGKWDLKSFTINHFETLDPTPLRNVVQDLRSIKGEWGAEAWDELDDLRHGGEKSH